MATHAAVRAALRLAALAEAALRRLPGAASFLDAWPDGATTRSVGAHSLPVLRWLPAAAAHTERTTQPLAAALLAEAEHLAWRQSYAAADFGPDFLDRYGWTELIGTAGPIASEGLACGVLMLGPTTTYPSHAHQAEEIYLPLAGTALWQQADGPPRSVPPGTLVHHPPWVAHAMMTGDAPLVALYAWRGGDLTAKPLILPQDR